MTTVHVDTGKSHEEITALLTDFTVSHGDNTMHQWRDMIPKIWAKYRDGYEFSGFDQTTITVHNMFYPEWWLEKVGYFNPMNLNHDDNAILFSTNPAGPDGEGHSSSAVMVGVVIGILVGFLGGKYMGVKESRRAGYHTIPTTVSF